MNTWPPIKFPPHWPIKQAKIRNEQIYDGFKALSLLEYFQRERAQLVVPHSYEQVNRFDSAMLTVNKHRAEQGLEEANHRCRKCAQVMKDPGKPDREVFAVAVPPVQFPTAWAHSEALVITFAMVIFTMRTFASLLTGMHLSNMVLRHAYDAVPSSQDILVVPYS
ncbi:hypothetical protein MPER_05301 [Moniliophthora perniciosa FA553]|nr:hypothetical protein MPER_05301 [Moniliophthora perniciosa FA553]